MKRRSPDPGAERKGTRTRQRIVREAAVLFNTRGFAGTSISDVSTATGLEKGGVYNHFASKDELALAAFDYAATIVRERLQAAVRTHAGDGLAQLAAMFDVYRQLAERPFITGGCPILNTAAEADDTHPALLDRARCAMDGWLELVRGALETAQTAGALAPAVNARAIAATIVAALEGGVLLSKVYRDNTPMLDVTGQLAAYLDTLRAVPA